MKNVTSSRKPKLKQDEEQQKRIAEARAEGRAREAAAQMRHDERMRLECEKLELMKQRSAAYQYQGSNL